MRNYLKIFTSILLAFIVVVGLSACGTPLEKPTGLEKIVDEQTEQEDAGEVLKQAGAEAKTKEESKKAEQEDAELSKVDAEKAEQVKEDSSEKAVDSKEENKESSAVETKKEEKVSNTSSESESEKKSSASSAPAPSAPSKSGSASTSSGTTKQPAEKTPQPTEKPKEKPVEKPKPEPVKNTIVHSIVISSNEIPLAPTEMEIEDGDTVLEALIVITMANKIHMDYRGGQGATAYIQGMGNVYEFDRGQGSGWMYRVNGIFPDRGAGVVPLLGGDIVEWLYTTDLGVDLGANLEPFRR